MTSILNPVEVGARVLAMEAILFNRADPTGTLGEMVGHKSGISLDRETNDRTCHRPRRGF
jgi:hypothetical protein